MEIKNFIKIYDDVLPLSALTNLLRFASSSNFKTTQIASLNNEIKTDLNIRKAFSLELSNIENSLTNVHWFNLLRSCFNISLNKYQKDLNLTDFYCGKISNIEILKYENSGFYTWHSDHFSEIPRTMSCIFLLNNDYEGGNLCFRNPDGSGEWEVDVKPNRIIVWPSNFLYPHTVKPVKKGTRYSVVAWTL